ncbi:hypothetical protein [Psychrobacter sp.]|uniref:alpha-glutamyl/putrescinyl thymine pyrophosphorylase clade 3 protein n=1 Tax=Psychrobacter sp. TaxID=56811 RepID=UPI0025E7446C|nr:hypothetical protein [Psychrobacter sp.]
MITSDKDNLSIKIAKDIYSYLQSNNIAIDCYTITYEILALQLLDRVKEDERVENLFKSDIHQEVSDPKSECFNPIKAIIFLKDKHYDEACWLSFLLIYTDDSDESDWAFMRKLYGAEGLGLKTALTWEVVNDAPHLLSDRLDELVTALAESHPKPKFGHHRAYESLKHLPMVFTSYIGFIHEQGGHEAAFGLKDKSVDRTDYFKTRYDLIRQNVYRFGRLSTFEFLCLLGKMRLADVEPNSCYIAEASGPKRGARLLFGMLSNEQLDEHAIGLANYLEVSYQQLEAALCHWQKSPNRFIKHR